MSRGGKRKAAYKGLMRKIGIIAFVAVNVLSVTLTPTAPALAASFTFTQNDFAVSADSSATAGHTGGAAQTGVTSFYSTSSSYLTTGASLTVATSTGSFAQTSWDPGSSATTAVHPTNQTGWAAYSATSTPISAGADLVLGQTTYAVTDDGTLSSTGAASGGGFSNGTNSSTTVSGSGSGASAGLSLASPGYKQISVGYGATCGLKTDGTVYCWGRNSLGQIGDNTTTQRNTPVQVLKGGATGDTTYLGDGTAKVAQISTGGYDTTCAVKTDGTAYCWGGNAYGQIGDNTTTQRLTPVQVLKGAATGDTTYFGDGAAKVAQVSVGSTGGATCAVKTDGTAYCWGGNAYGQIGDNTTTQRLTPVQIHGVGNSGFLTGVAQISMGGGGFVNTTCAVKTDGTAYCWGNNGKGQIGDNTTTQRLTPVQIHGVGNSGFLTGVAQINESDSGNNSSDTTTCAVKTDGTAYCWGSNLFGQIGDNTTTATSTPVQIHGVGNSGFLTGVAQISVTGTNNSSVYGTTCVTKIDGTAYCWGYNGQGQIGDNTTTQRNTPVQVLKGAATGDTTYFGDGTAKVAQISTGAGATFGTTCAVKTDGTAYCWGGNAYGQIGDNTTTQRLTPVQIHGVGNSGFLNLNVYNASGTFTSAVIDLGGPSSFNTISWNATLSGQTITMKVRSDSNSDMSGATAWASCSNVTSGGNASDGGCVTNGHRYAQYQAALSTSNTAVTPTLDDVTINYPQYTTAANLTSSAYNTGDATNKIGSIMWTESGVSGSQDVKFQIRTAPDSSGMPGTWTSWLGPTGTGDYYTDPAGGETINSAHTDGVDDQWIQYKVFMTSGGGASPTLSNVTLAYLRGLDSTNGYTLISSPYDSTSSANVIGDVRMNMTALPSGTSAKIQVRTAASQGGLSSATWCGTDCTGSTYFTASAGTNTFTSIPASLADGADDQWFQYRITLIPSSNNLNAPEVTSAGVTYVVNTAPTVTNVTATTAATTQGATDANAGKITVTYDLTDDVEEITDIYGAYLFYDVGVTLSGGTPYNSGAGTLTVSDATRMPSAGFIQSDTEVLQYTGKSSNTLTGIVRNTWPTASTTKSSLLATGASVWIKTADAATSGAVGIVTKGTGKSITWNQRSESQLANYSKYDAKVRVLVHDSNLANQLSSQSGSSTDSTNNVIIDNLAPTSTTTFTFDAGVAGQTGSATLTVGISSDATSTAQFLVADDAATHSSPVSGSWTTFATSSTATWAFDSDLEAKTIKYQFRDPYGNTVATSTTSTLAPLSTNAFVVADVSKVSASYWREFVGWEVSASPSFASYKLDYATSSDNGTTYSTYATATSPIVPAANNYYVHSDLNNSLLYRYRIGLTGANGNTSVRTSTTGYLTAKPDGTRNYDEGGGGDDTTAPTVTNVAISAIKATSATFSFNATDGTPSITNAAVYFATGDDYASNVLSARTGRDKYTRKVGNPSYVTDANGNAVLHTISLLNASTTISLLKGTAYRYALESCDLIGNCTLKEDTGSAGYTFTTQNGPAIVSGSIVATPAFDSASVTWKTDKASDSIVFYATSGLSALVNPISVGSNAQVTVPGGDGNYVHTVTIPNLTYSATYYYKVRSTDQDASSVSYTQYDDSPIGSFTTTTQTPPTITAAAACTTTSSTATITWTTDQFSTSELSLLSADVGANYFSVVAGAQVAQYPTGTINSASRAAVGYVTAHSNTFTGLTESTTYYAKVRSLNASGGEVSATLSCATPAKDVVTVGRTIVEVGDVTAPLIASLVIKDIKATSATIAWTTDEQADSLVKYGVTMNYGGLGGSEEMTTDHTVTVSGLNPRTAYNFKVMSADQRGNRAYSGDQTFTTLSVEEEALLAKEDLESLKKELEELRGKAKTQESLQGAVQRFKAILKSVSTDVSLQDLEELTTEITDTITEITQEVVPPAIIGGVPQVDIEANKATITWRTNKPAGSLIALVPQDEYDPNAKDPYVVQVGQPREEVTTHVVTVPNLEPATAYHFQIRSQAKVGPEGKSRDFVFETKAELPQILDYSFKRITENSITVAWKTNTLSNSQVRYTPFADGDLVSADARTQGKPEFVKDHEVTVANLPSNTNFLIEISSADVTTASASKVIGTIRTTVDEKTPTISKVRSESTIFPGKTERTQTLIYWETDEPSSSQIFWKEGVGKGDLLEFSKLDQEYTTSHVMVLTSFKPGAVYRFQVESADPSNNKGRSTDFTILTPKKGETVIDLIITNFQDIFGFLKQL